MKLALVLAVLIAAVFYDRWRGAVKELTKPAQPITVSIPLECPDEAPTPTACGWDTPILGELSNDEFTRVAYRAILRREPDARHLDLDRGWTRYSMLGALMDSPEFRERVLKEMKP